MTTVPSPPRRLAAPLAAAALLWGCAPEEVQTVEAEACAAEPRPVAEGAFPPGGGWWERVEAHPDEPGEGRAWLSPDTLPAGADVTFALHFEVGPSGIGPAGGFAVRDPVFYGMRWSHYGAFTTDPERCTDVHEVRGAKAEGLLTARAESGAEVLVYRESCDVDRHRDMMTEVIAPDGLPPGDVVVLTFGDTSANEASPDGDPTCAVRAPWRAYRNVEMPVAVRRTPDEDYRPIASSPTLDVVADPEPVHAMALLPSQAVMGEAVELRLVGLDRYGNPSPGFEGLARCRDRCGRAELPASFRIAGGKGHARARVAFPTPGVHWLDCEGPGPFRYSSNPIRVHATAGERSVYWGDLHAHNGHGHPDPEGRWIDENVVYARDVMGLDFGAVVPKARPLEIDEDALWSRLKAVCAEEESPEYVPFLGYEWMGDPRRDGHHNVYFDSCEGELPDARSITPLGDEGSLFDRVRPLGRHAVIVPHATRFTGHNWDVPSEQRTAAEVFSAWGDGLADPADPGAVQQALLRGWRMGFIASSDNHDGFMGNPLANFNDRGGLAALIAPARTRADLFAALRERRSYATDGARILLDFQAVDRIAADAVVTVEMGERYVGRVPTLRAEVHGTAPLERISLFAGRWPGEEVVEVASWAPSGAWSARVTFDATGGPLPFAADAFYYLAVEQRDGGRAWSSPIWIDRDCGEAADPLGICDDDGDGRSEIEGDPDDTVPGDAPPVPSPRCDGGAGPAGASGPAALLAALAALAARRRREPEAPRRGGRPDRGGRPPGGALRGSADHAHMSPS